MAAKSSLYVLVQRMFKLEQTVGNLNKDFEFRGKIVSDKRYQEIKNDLELIRQMSRHVAEKLKDIWYDYQ